MADAVREEARRLRQSAREQRRGAAGALDGVGETIRSKTEEVFDEDFVDSVKALVKPAVAAAVVGGLTGLAKAMFDRRGDAEDSQAEPEQRSDADLEAESEEDVPQARGAQLEDEQETEEPEGQAAQLDDDEQDEADQPEGHAAELEDEQEDEEPEGRADQLDDDEQDESDEDTDSELQRAQLYEQAEGQEDEEGDDDEQEPEARAESDYDSEAESSDEDSEEQEAGASLSDAMAPVDKAREIISRVMGSDAESVSGIARSNGNWKVNVEVVELHRIPESTDVMASYEVVLDGDCNVVSLERTRRYRRSQVEEG